MQRRVATRVTLAGAALLAVFAVLGADRAHASETYAWRVCASGAAQGGAIFQTNAPDPDFNGVRDCTWEGADPPRTSWVGVQTGSTAGTVAGGDYARMHWDMPTGTTIARIYANWWQQLGQGFEHRLQLVGAGGTRDVFESATADDDSDTPREIRWSPGSAVPFTAFESALVCKRSGNGSCDASRQSRAALNQIDFLLSDQRLPVPKVSGDATSSAWQSGIRVLDFSDSDVGSGIFVSTAVVDGKLASSSAQNCKTKAIAGSIYAMASVPCPAAAAGHQQVATSTYADGEHSLTHCAADFAGNVGCSDPATVRFDNTAPGAVDGLALAQGSGWQRSNGFDLSWQNPDQGHGAPVAAALYRVVRDGGGYDSGVQATGGEAITAAHVTVPVPGSYTLSLWLRDGAGNSTEAAARRVTARFDDVPPRVAFADAQDPGRPEELRAPVSDADSGVASGTIHYRRAGSSTWTPLTTELRDAGPSGPELVARFPSDELGRGLYELRAEAFDAAGNHGASERRANGTLMVLRNPVKAETRLTAWFAGNRRCDRRRRCRPASTRSRMLVAYGAGARLSGTLRDAAGRPLPGRGLRVRYSADPGSSTEPSELRTRTGAAGRYSVWLAPGPSRTVRVVFPGTDTLARATAGPLRLVSRAAIWARITPRHLRNGRRMSIRGSVGHAGAPIAAGGKLVALQFYDAGSRRWRPVKLARTDRRGRIHTAYRFRYIARPARIAFRVAVIPERGWPYAFGATRRLWVWVRP